MKNILTIAGILVALCCALPCYAAGPSEDAQALVTKGIAYIRANGPQKAYEAFTDPHGGFVNGPLYLFVVDYQGKTLAHGGNPKLVGMVVIDLKDADGKEFQKEMINVAKNGGGWVDYKWVNPESKKIEQKTTCVQPVAEHSILVGCGFYKQ